MTRGERGSGTLLMMSAAFLVLASGLAVALWAAVSTARHRAATAADLAALSAAQMIQSGGDPCESARRIASVHRATLQRCEVEGEEVMVVAGVPVELGSLGRPQVRSMARAGPVHPDDG
jgi:secretion/DNA translocation related TadE-like protein